MKALRFRPFWRVVALAGKYLKFVVGSLDVDLAELSILLRIGRVVKHWARHQQIRVLGGQADGGCDIEVVGAGRRELDGRCAVRRQDRYAAWFRPRLWN